MAIAEYASCTVTLTSSETSLVSGTTTLQNITDDGVYQALVDLSDAGPSDSGVVTVKEKIISGGSQQAIYETYFSGTQNSPLVIPSLILMHGWDITITGASGLVVSASIRRVA